MCFLRDVGCVLAPLVKIFTTHGDSKGNFKRKQNIESYTTTIAALVCFKYAGFQKKNVCVVSAEYIFVVKIVSTNRFGILNSF